MSYCKQIGKDRIIFVTHEELSKESKIKLSEPKEEDREPGLLLPSGEINWNCPCIGGMASGPCGFQFREAFSCFHGSQSENRGAECVEKFSILQECMASYPNLYPKRPDEDDDDDVGVVFEDDLHSDGTGRKESLQLGQDISLKEDSKKDS